MSSINFDDLYKSLLSGIESLAKGSLKEFENAAKADGEQALNDIKQNLQQWVKELETGAITRDDLEYLLQENEALEKMVALKEAGMAEIHIDTFRNNVINLVVSTVTGLIKV
jgi:regulator of replication initiation timing